MLSRPVAGGGGGGQNLGVHRIIPAYLLRAVPLFLAQTSRLLPYGAACPYYVRARAIVKVEGGGQPGQPYQVNPDNRPMATQATDGDLPHRRSGESRNPGNPPEKGGPARRGFWIPACAGTTVLCAVALAGWFDKLTMSGLWTWRRLCPYPVTPPGIPHIRWYHHRVGAGL